MAPHSSHGEGLEVRTPHTTRRRDMRDDGKHRDIQRGDADSRGAGVAGEAARRARATWATAPPLGATTPAARMTPPRTPTIWPARAAPPAPAPSWDQPASAAAATSSSPPAAVPPAAASMPIAPCGKTRPTSARDANRAKTTKPPSSQHRSPAGPAPRAARSVSRLAPRRPRVRACG